MNFSFKNVYIDENKLTEIVHLKNW